MIIFGGGDIATGINKFPPCHLIDKEECDVRNLINVIETVQKYQPKVVINCAGVSNLQMIKDSDANRWIDEIETNLIGSYNIAKIATEFNIKTIIFIGSVAGKFGKANHSGYCASKAGVISLVQSLAMEGYNAYCISPGRVNTKMREKDFPNEDIKTRLTTKQVAKVVKEILNGKYQSGDNIIIRKRGYRTLRRIDKGQPWKKYLNVRNINE